MLMKLAFACVLSVLSVLSQAMITTGLVQDGAPAYAEWSRLAILQAQERYPDAQIIDYLYMGSRTDGELTEESFRLWLREPDREYGITVRVRYTTASGKLKDVRFQEIQPPSGSN